MTENGEWRPESGRPQVLLVLLLVFSLPFVSCAVLKPSEPQQAVSKIVDSALVDQRNDGKPPRALPVNRPVQISFESDPIVYAAISGDGKTLAYVLEREGRSSLWLSALGSKTGALHQKRLQDMGRISAPSLSQHAEKMVFVATDYDAKGDIYLLTMDTPESIPRRLTGRDSADGAPALSPDGRRVYFQRLLPGVGLPQLSVMEIAAQTDSRNTPEANVLREGAFPAASPDGDRLAFVSFTEDPGGDIHVLDLKTGKAKAITAGPAQDLYPAWSTDGKSLYFSRVDADTNKDGIIDFSDKAVICRIASESSGGWAYPLTSEAFSAYQPMTTPSQILFLSTLNGTGNIWTLPLTGQIPTKENASDQMALARLLASRIPQEDSLAVLAWTKVLEKFGAEKKIGAEAACEIGNLYQDMGREVSAINAYESVLQEFKEIHPEADLAAIRLAVLQAEKAWRATLTDYKREDILENAVKGIQKISESESLPLKNSTFGDASRLKARATIAQAQLLGDLGQNAASLDNAISLLEQVGNMRDLPPALKAEALFNKALVSNRMGQASVVIPIYLSVITQYPGTLWADRSVERIIDTHISGSGDETDQNRMQMLARLAEKHRQDTPQLSMGALNRMGDTAFQEGDWPQAKRWYREVLNQHAKRAASLPKDEPLSTQVAAARLALAEILYKEELFRQALDLYEKEMVYRPYEDRLYGLARAAYVQKSLAAANFLFALGEIPAAQKIYGDLIRENPDLVQAHRGYIKSAVSMKEIDSILNRYKRQLAKDPNNPVLLYATGLCLTYLKGRKPLNEAKDLIETAIGKQGQNPYFHQSLGYIFEVSETVYGEPGGLEKALLSYQKAYFLNNPKQDPQNSANLALNLGNIHFLLGQYSRALERYLERLESKVPFDHEDTEILFYRRLGGAAFQVNDPDISIDAYRRALGLIQQRIDPRRASEVMGKLNTYIFDRILTPAQKRSNNAENVKILARQQSDIHKDLFRATTKPFGPPPDPRWQQYKQAMTTIMSVEERLLGDLSPLITAKKNETTQTLSLMLSRARDALEFPGRMISLKAELLDRLGLAYQEGRRWLLAADAFEKAFQLNLALGNTRNLAANGRSVAYNTYMAAGVRAGKERVRLLKDALKQFQETKALLNQYGTVEPKEKKANRKRYDGGNALLNVSLHVALDKTSGSEAVYGFSREQEARLAQAFISRIETELGVLAKARDAIDKQLQPYQKATTISDKDLYGVSLMSHRDGQLRFALGQPQKAFQSFKRSAELALKLKNPVSAAMNVVNMAWALRRIPPNTLDDETLRAQLAMLDRKTSRLLKRSQDVLEPLVPSDYHNRMGALMLTDNEPFAPASPEKAAENMARLKQAGVHFTLGLASMKSTLAAGRPMTRRTLALETALQLNQAQVALALGDSSVSEIHAKKALETAKKGLLPQYEWRAMVRSGDLKGALKALKTVPLVVAGCAPHEIRNAFSPMVASLIQREDAEGALNLLENLSEIERFQRMAPVVTGRIAPSERAKLLTIFPRLMTLQRLKGELHAAENGEKQHLTERILQEQILLRKIAGKREKGDESYVEGIVSLPAQLTRSTALQDELLFFLSLCFEMERVADLAVAEIPENGKSPERDRYTELLTLYQQTLKGIKKLATREKTPGVAALFAPYPMESIDLMEVLPHGTRAIRIFEKAPTGNTWTAFQVTEDDIRVKSFTADHDFHESEGSRTVLIYENPLALPFKTSGPLALNATYLVRSVENRKPFKIRIVEIGATYQIPADFEVTQIPASAEKKEIVDALPGKQGLLLGGPVYNANTVPTRPKEVPVYGPAMGLDQGRTLPLFTIFGRVSHASLAMAPEAAPEDIYMVAQMFSLMGISSLVLPNLISPNGPRAHSSVVTLFFEAYGKNPLQKALTTALESPRANGERWMNLGYWGMSDREALDLAKKRFKAYVQDGIASFKRQEPLYALASFENALMVARQVENLSRYEPQLLVYARESAYNAERYEIAAQYADDLVRFWARKKPDSKEQAEALLKLGLIRARMEQYDSAIPVLEEGTEIMANLELEDLQVSALNDLGVVLENATDYDGALEQFQAAAKLSKTLDKKERLARQHSRMGRIYDLRMSQYAKAKIHYVKAFELYETLDKTDEMAQALLDAGRCDRLLGNFTGAEDHYQRALKLLKNEKTGLRAENKILAGILMEQANNHWFQARYQEAFKGRQTVYEMALKNNWTLEQVNSLNTAGLIWWTLGDHPAALRELEKALELAKKLRARRDEVATTLNNMGLVYGDAGDYEKAVSFLDEALVIDRKINSKWAMAYDLKNLGLTRLRMGEAEKAVNLFSEALELAKTIGNRINQAKILVGYGESLMALNKLKEAQGRFQEALDLSRQMVLREVEWRALYGLAQLRLKEGKKGAARDLLEAAVKVIEGMRAEIKLDQLKDGFIANKMAVYETLVSLLVNMGLDAEAFHVAERSRARNLIDLLGNQRLSLHGAVNQKLYDGEKALKNQMAEYETLMAQTTDAEERTVYGKALEQARDRYRDLMLEIQLINPDLASIISVDPLTLAQVQELLEPGTALLAYYLVPDEILCWFITRDRMELFRTPLGRQTLAQSVLDYRRTLQNLEPAEAQSEELYKWLLAPVKGSLKGMKAVGIVPHHILHHLSFATLFDGKEYLVDQVPLFSLPSASVLRHTERYRGLEKNTKVLAVGNPDLKNPALALPFAEKEVASIGWRYPNVTVLTGDKATEGWVVRNISNFGVIHLASHGEFDPVNPLFSSVKLASDDEDDGDLRASEIFGLDIQAVLVMLSACQTGLGKITSGDDVIGMNRAFLYAGTNAIMSSLWRVSDISTALLVKQFYREFKNKGKAESLQRAMQHVKNRFPHPGYWGAFVLVGDYR
ncbi:MAG: CHAT domain-containing protein [Deltaproteobacteria bacterium]|nr:CHAT domain-containing protein [Deltaproteobacteria bacterium]